MKTLDWFVNQPNLQQLKRPDRPLQLRVGIYGGEPLVEWAELVAVIERFREIETTLGIQMRGIVISNMTLLTEARMCYLAANRVRLSPSIDGCPEAQDAFRVDASGNGTSGVVYDAARILLKYRPGQSVRMTVAPETAQYFSRSIAWLWDVGFKQINAIFAGGVDWPDDAVRTMTDEIAKVTDWWIERVRAGDWPSLFHIRNTIAALQRGRPLSLCGAGVHRVAVDTAGNATPCHRFANPSCRPDWRLGNIFADSYETILGHPLRQMIQGFRRSYQPGRFAQCGDCCMSQLCYVWCYHEAMTDGRYSLDGGKLAMTPAPHFCAYWPVYHRETVRALRTLAAEGNEKARAILTEAQLPLEIQSCRT